MPNDGYKCTTYSFKIANCKSNPKYLKYHQKNLYIQYNRLTCTYCQKNSIKSSSRSSSFIIYQS